MDARPVRRFLRSLLPPSCRSRAFHFVTVSKLVVSNPVVLSPAPHGAPTCKNIAINLLSGQFLRSSNLA